jgi:uncharacterized protein YdiU (UPF0061 family)
LKPIDAPDQFGGDGYGDGRAVSIAEVEGLDGRSWELQLKGGGTTPFSRGHDGRAVLRSSVREFLVSEAMHHLGVPTTRALSLVASQDEYIPRAWYRKDEVQEAKEDAEEEAKHGFGSLESFDYKRFDSENKSTRPHTPNMMYHERCAITCRVAPSFIRVGHFEVRPCRRRMTEDQSCTYPPQHAHTPPSMYPTRTTHHGYSAAALFVLPSCTLGGLGEVYQGA